MRLWFAITCFFKVLFQADFAAKCRSLVDGVATSQHPTETTPAVVPAAPVASPRSDAIALLATLQREARFVDMVSESLDAYSDAQIGAAARDVLRDSGKVLTRVFSLRPVVGAEEGTTVEVPAGYDTGSYRLTGSVSRDPPFPGKLVHAGWQATKCDLPTWTGSQKAALIVAPAEVQLG